MKTLGVALAVLHLASCRSVRPLRDDGRDWYVRACASCHGVDGRGGGPVASALRVPPSDLTALAERGGTFPRRYAIAVTTGAQEITGHGTREMPVWSERFGTGAEGVASAYARRRVEMLADHLESLQR